MFREKIEDISVLKRFKGLKVFVVYQFLLKGPKNDHLVQKLKERN